MRKHGWSTVLIAFVAILMLVSCSKKESPEEAASRYIKAWNEQQFETMYEQLSESTKENIAKEAFIERYETIYSGIRLTALDVELVLPEDKKLVRDDKDEAKANYQMHMETVAGAIDYAHEFSLVLEEQDGEERWAIKWNPTMIFPEMEEGDKVRVNTLKAKRGEIVDRNGQGLAVNGKALSIGIVPERLPGEETTSLKKLADLLQMSLDSVENKRNASWVEPDMFVPMKTIAKDDSRLEKLLDIQGVTYVEEDARIYPLKEAAAHLIGYIQEMNAEELEEHKSEGYVTGDVIGKNGLEKVFEKQLRGVDGGRIYITDEEGNEKHEVAKQEPVDGETLKLTLDSEVQQNVYAQLKGEAGTATALHPKTGEVLALVNAPAYDPNKFVLGMTGEQWETLNEDPKKPLLNRFAHTYAPGSVIKPMTAAIALDSETVKKNTTFDIRGLTWQKDESWGDYSVTRVTDPRKPVNVETALIYSDNIYFAQVALQVGETELLKRAKQFGFGEALPFEYPIKKSKMGEEPFKSDIQLADSGYGQGQVEMSILHTALMYTAFLNEGHIVKPVLLKPEGTPDNPPWKKAATKKETANLINETLLQVVEHPNGTATNAKVSGKKIAGKTGTSELKSTKTETGQENGFFVGYHYDTKDLLVAMLIEHVEHRGGSKFVASKVKNVLSQ